MKITEIKLNPSKKPESKLLAIGSVKLDDELVISGVRVFKGEKGPFVRMPQCKTKNGEYRDIAFPVIADLRKDITEKVLESYQTLAKAA